MESELANRPNISSFFDSTFAILPKVIISSKSIVSPLEIFAPLGFTSIEYFNIPASFALFVLLFTRFSLLIRLVWVVTPYLSLSTCSIFITFRTPPFESIVSSITDFSAIALYFILYFFGSVALPRAPLLIW